MAYTYLQFIGYSIDTAPQDNGDGTETYLGLPVAAQDIQARCALMMRAMEAARDALPAYSPPQAPGTTLNVFMAPEFFFRGDTGAYEMDDVQLVIATLQDMAADAQWDDWAFCFGTILGTSAPHDPNPPYDIDPDAVREIYNFALIQEGGVDSQGQTGARVVMKELKSDIDFIAGAANPGGYLLAEVDPLTPSQGGGPGREQQRLAYDGAGIFSLRGMTWATDICLDHLSQRLQRSPQTPGAQEVQVQLVPSCGADIDPDGVVALPGGYVFNVDGHNGSHAVLQEVDDPMVDVDVDQTVAVDDSDITITTGSPPAQQDVAISQLYRDGAGEVVIFDPVGVPPAAQVQGTVVPLKWQACADYQLCFDLVYDGDGDLRTVLCEVVSRKTNFQGNNYFLPFDVDTEDKEGKDVQISVKLGAGSGGYDYAVWCAIHVPGFDFEGNAFQFDDNITTGQQPETIW
jgi:hypothetical protein